MKIAMDLCFDTFEFFGNRMDYMTHDDPLGDNLYSMGNGFNYVMLQGGDDMVIGGRGSEYIDVVGAGDIIIRGGRGHDVVVVYNADAELDLRGIETVIYNI